MPLTPMDIQQKTFGPELRGYNMDEVDDFLDEVVTTLKDYDQRIRDAQDRIRALEAELSSRGEQESAISRALLAAQRQADAMIEEAQEEADRIRADARNEADRLRSDREAERMSLTQDIARMRATVADLKRRIVELANSAGAGLDEMDAAIATASAELGDPIASPSDTPESLDSEPEEESVDVAQGGDWGAVSEDASDDPGSDWEEDVATEPEWQTPSQTVDEFEEVEEVEEEIEVVDLAESAEENRDESDEPFGGLADELANEVASPDQASEADPFSEAAPPSRRPWERGSV